MGRELELDFSRKTKKVADIKDKMQGVKKFKVSVTRTKNKIANVIEMAREFVRSGKLKPIGEIKTVWAKDEQYLKDYVQKCLKNGEYIFDYETTGLDVFNDFIVGVCLYTPNETSLYIPLNHTDLENNRIDGQMKEETAKEILLPLITSKAKLINHNLKFDGSVSMYHWGTQFGNYYWDTLLAGKLLNENEKNHQLKYLWGKYVKKDTSDKVSFGDLFEDIPFNYIPIEIASIYGGNDGFVPYQLYEFQKKYITLEHKRKDFKQIAEVFYDIEMPLIPLLVEMELRGVAIDEEKAQELELKYSSMLNIAEADLDKIAKKYEKQILANSELNRLTNGTGKINYNSPPQLKIYCYKILKLPSVDRRNPQGTGKEIIAKWLEHSKVKGELKQFVEKFKEYKTVGKLLSTYIIKIPKAKESKTNAVHTQFNQYGAVTGRFSSSHPIYKINLQNIPSRNKEIRTIFKARDGHVLIGSDFSQIEPRTLASLSGDEEMIQAYRDGKDLYATMGARVYKVGYWDCMEKFEDGTPNPKGKERRNSMKSVLLGIMYERGAKAIAEQFNQTITWAESLVNDFKKAYPKIELHRMKVINQAETFGYVSTLFGRKRRLPNMQLQNKDDWKYKDAHRQVLNAEIQGTAGDLMKLSMIEIGNDKEFRELGGRMLITVHDELICETPKENAIRCGEIMSNIMKAVGERALGLPMKCDVEFTEVWYGADVEDELLEDIA